MAKANDLPVRLAAFDWLASQVALHGDVLPWSILAEGFTFEGRRVPLVSQQGIFKPAVLPQIPLSIRTTHEGRYDDSFDLSGLLRYAYRGTDVQHRDNVGLREAMAGKVPLVYFHAVVPAKYLAAWPVFVVGDNPRALRFTVALDDARHASAALLQGAHAVGDPAAEDARRTYITRTLRQRLHQRGFRERVLQAYREHCAFCRLRHQELLDAAHIIGDLETDGEPIVSNGLALCKLHHAAYDTDFLGVRPDYVIEVRRDLLEEEDGPMLLHGLKGMQGRPLLVPGRRDWKPDPARLEIRWERFRSLGQR
ncbi:MAG TPA: HNH endonuclease [Candidatus Polarisedimenticolaceae bacterium]|nr:HNH endonuclease [Candidatus Polarisedimenticolaceae bacterium]